AQAEVNSLPQAPKRSLVISGQPSPSIPSGAWQQLRTPTFSVSYPEGWQVYGDRGSSMLTIAPREGIVQSSTGATQVGVGAILSYFVPEANGRDLRSATDDLVHHLHAANPSTKLIGNHSRTVRIDGSDGLITMMEGNSPYRGNETDAVLTVMRPQGLFYLIFIAPERDFSKVESTFQQMVTS